MESYCAPAHMVTELCAAEVVKATEHVLPREAVMPGVNLWCLTPDGGAHDAGGPALTVAALHAARVRRRACAFQAVLRSAALPRLVVVLGGALELAAVRDAVDALPRYRPFVLFLSTSYGKDGRMLHDVEEWLQVARGLRRALHAWRNDTAKSLQSRCTPPSVALPAITAMVLRAPARCLCPRLPSRTHTAHGRRRLSAARVGTRAKTGAKTGAETGAKANAKTNAKTNVARRGHSFSL